jgi:hypothetical protein
MPLGSEELVSNLTLRQKLSALEKKNAADYDYLRGYVDSKNGSLLDKQIQDQLAQSEALEATKVELTGMVEDARSIADGKIDVFYQDDAPTSAKHGDLWIDTNDGNKLYRYIGDTSTWDVARDQGIVTALDAATTAEAKVDGKIGCWYTNFEPLPPDYVVNLGDLWIDTGNSYYMRFWSGLEWLDASRKLSTNEVQTNHIATGAINQGALYELPDSTGYSLADDYENWHNIPGYTLTVPMDYSGVAMIFMECQLYLNVGAVTGHQCGAQVRMVIDGNPGFTNDYIVRNTDEFQVVASLYNISPWNAGYHTVQIQIKRPYGFTNCNVIVLDRKLTIFAFKKANIL